MNCEQARQAWHRRHDDGVTEPSAAQHLQTCDACRSYHAQMDAIAHGLDELREESDSIVSRRGQSRATGPRRMRMFVAHPLTRVAAVLVLGVTVATYVASNRSMQPSDGGLGPVVERNDRPVDEVREDPTRSDIAAS